MKWPTSISGHVMYPLTRDGFQVELEQQTLYGIDCNGEEFHYKGTPMYDQQWLFATITGMKEPLRSLFKLRSNLVRAQIGAKHDAVDRLISEIASMTAAIPIILENENGNHA